jgi:hypothetical protein
MRAQKVETEVIRRNLGAINALRCSRQPDFLWCIHCERAYQFGEFRNAGDRQLCPYVNCAGSEVFAWDWQKVRSANPHYPPEPLQGVVYPLFGRDMASPP